MSVIYFMMPKTASNFIVDHVLPPEIEHIGHSNFARDREKIKAAHGAGHNLTFLRDPANRLYSAYRWVLEGSPGHPVLKRVCKRLGSFKAVVGHLDVILNNEDAIHFFPQTKWITDSEKLLIQCIGLYENLKEDIKRIALELNFQWTWSEKRVYSGPWHKDDYHDEYTPEMLKKVKMVYAKDYELLERIKAGNDRAF